jgi:hypothetical protein
LRFVVVMRLLFLRMLMAGRRLDLLRRGLRGMAGADYAFSGAVGTGDQQRQRQEHGLKLMQHRYPPS